MSKRFDGKVVLITGSASGMGRATALRMGREGASVFCADINGTGAEETASTIRAEGGQARSATADVADPARCQALVAEAVAAFGGLDILCNVAGFGGLKPLADETAEG